MTHLLISRIAAIGAVVAWSGSAALAHPGDHSHMTLSEIVGHLQNEPWHALPVAALLLLLGAAWLWRGRKSDPKSDQESAPDRAASRKDQ